MKFAITGHTNGLGKALFETIPGSIGFSLSTGYDISNPVDRDRIYEESKDCDIFINNAYHETGQLDLMNLFLERWNGQKKTFVNIGSTIVFIDHEKIKYPHLQQYSLAKRVLDELSRKNMLTLFPKVITVVPGAMNTRLTDYPGINIDKMDVKNVARFILDTLTRQDEIEVRYVVIKPELEAKNYQAVLGA